MNRDEKIKEIFRVLSTQTFVEFDQEVLTPYLSGDDEADFEKVLTGIGSLFNKIL